MRLHDLSKRRHIAADYPMAAIVAIVLTVFMITVMEHSASQGLAHTVPAGAWPSISKKMIQLK